MSEESDPPALPIGSADGLAPVPAIEVDITALAAGGDGVARDGQGRVVFVPHTAPGDRVRVAIGKTKASFARGDVLELVVASPSRVAPPCKHFAEGCGGCQWQHVDRAGQLAAKQAIVAGALRKLGGLALELIADPVAPYGWRRRARFHVAGGVLGLYAPGSRKLVRLTSCGQLDDGLDAAMAVLFGSSLPDGEVAVVRGESGAVAIGIEKPWRAAGQLVGRADIVGVIAGDVTHGEPVLELEPGLWGGPWDFAQASVAGNRALVAAARTALGAGPGTLLELYAGAGNITRGFRDDGWEVTPSDGALPARPPAKFEVGAAAAVLERLATGGRSFDAIALDPPRTGAGEAIAGIIRLGPRTIVYVSCDPATLARDADRLVAAGYRAERAWPLDLMPQTAHVEVVLRLSRGA